jgi:glycosyltransferase involved in cell wall biosynthesis
MVLRDPSCGGHLRVLCLTTSFPNTKDDPAGFFVYQLSDALARQGVQVEVLTPSSQQEGRPWPNSCKIHRFSYAPRKWQTLAQLPGGIPVALSSNRKNYLLLPTFFAAFICNIMATVRRVDLILANWAICGALVWFLTPFHKKPVVTVLRGSDVKTKKHGSATSSKFLQLALKGSKAIVCVGKDLEIWVRTRCSHPQKVHLVPNGIHEQFFLVGPPNHSHTFNLLFVGSLIPRKGVDTLLKAINILRNLNIHLSIAGRGPLENELKGLVSELEIEPLVTFKGEIPPGRPMAQIMSDSHCLVLPSHHEGRPNVMLEAMAAGRPIIGSDIQGIRELVQESKGGGLFHENDIEDLARAIGTLVRSPGKAEEMGRSGRSWVLDQELTWDKTAKSYIRIFLECLSSWPS